MIFVIMGACGCGKTTVGKLLAEKIQLPFIEGDDFHSASNRKKMSQGIPLNDEDRIPWLLKLHMELQKHPGSVLACSALKETYRNILVHGNAKPYESRCTMFVLLEADASLLEERLLQRKGHFMPLSLIESQLATLQPFCSHEQHFVINAGLPCDKIIDLILKQEMIDLK